MKRFVGLMALLIVVLMVTPAMADFYVIAGGGRLGTAITTLPIAITEPGVTPTLPLLTLRPHV